MIARAEIKVLEVFCPSLPIEELRALVQAAIAETVPLHQRYGQGHEDRHAKSSWARSNDMISSTVKNCL
ncbi:hypothetical protein [Candidatus Villigracilis affinis]|uniref:hypothetical protein n=1 Tax=Candidatus Villigracilis affinis TaxID=3140682 RepID=UPI001E051180|nr:hypothetical protein [Anaerolineales bacterium]